MLNLEKVSVSVEDKKIIEDLSLSIVKGETVAIMGPNGSGKSSLANALMGHPNYTLEGNAVFLNEDLGSLSPDERAKLGLFLSFQYPSTVPGVTLQNFLRTAYNNTHEPLSIPKFKKLLKEKMELLKIDSSFAERYLNEGWSGGEKKRGEILQLAILQPKLAILDETDSGLDIDAIKIVSEGVNQVKTDNPDMAIIIITHYKRILEYIKPSRILVLAQGKIVEEGTPELIDKLEAEGYDWVNKA